MLLQKFPIFIRNSSDFDRATAIPMCNNFSDSASTTAGHKTVYKSNRWTIDGIYSGAFKTE